MVKIALETKCRQPGGKRVNQALMDAQANLKTLEPKTLRLIDAGIEEISALCTEAGDARPADASLLRMRALSDELTGYCAAVHLPGMDKAFIRMCQLADAVLHSSYWKSETFGPTLTVLRLTRQQALSEEQLGQLFRGIDSCTEKFLSHRIIDQSANPTTD